MTTKIAYSEFEIVSESLTDYRGNPSYLIGDETVSFAEAALSFAEAALRPLRDEGFIPTRVRVKITVHGEKT